MYERERAFLWSAPDKQAVGCGPPASEEAWPDHAVRSAIANNVEEETTKRRNMQFKKYIYISGFFYILA